MPDPVSVHAVADALRALGVPGELVRGVPPLPQGALGVLVYGSQARGDAVEGSDLDILVAVDRPRVSYEGKLVSVSYYTKRQLETGAGTLFGAHLARDAQVLSDPQGTLSECLESMGEVNTARVFERARQMSCIFTCLDTDLPRYLPGLLREARYLLRSALYAAAISEGAPCFSVRQLADRHRDPRLVDLLASRGAHESQADLLEIIERLASVVGEPDVNPYGSLESLVVNLWGSGSDTLGMGFLALRSSGDGSYADVEKILL